VYKVVYKTDSGHSTCIYISIDILDIYDNLDIYYNVGYIYCNLDIYISFCLSFRHKYGNSTYLYHFST